MRLDTKLLSNAKANVSLSKYATKQCAQPQVIKFKL